jgi:hypothetical protein
LFTQRKRSQQFFQNGIILRSRFFIFFGHLISASYLTGLVTVGAGIFVVVCFWASFVSAIWANNKTHVIHGQWSASPAPTRHFWRLCGLSIALTLFLILLLLHPLDELIQDFHPLIRRHIPSHHFKAAFTFSYLVSHLYLPPCNTKGSKTKNTTLKINTQTFGFIPNS